MRDRVTIAHDELRKYALKENFDYLLVLDQDIIPPRNIIEQLMQHKKDAISALYFGHHEVNGENKIMPFAWSFISREGTWGKVGYITDVAIQGNDLIEIAFSGMGCVLLSKKILKKIKFRYDESIDAWDDRWLGYDIYKEGFKFYLDPRIKCKHLYLKRPFDYHEIKKQGLV